MIVNPLTGQVLNSNPEGHNQYTKKPGSNIKPSVKRYIGRNKWLRADTARTERSSVAEQRKMNRKFNVARGQRGLKTGNFPRSIKDQMKMLGV